ncbi:MT-A70 family protein [Oxytricha trifallax]|uniref:mRNA m(6)A methyltransferase n=1 Tax=Oxytricha trifallax TaxID=1172189 RepID=A0A073ICG6_9SPIT|nr:MT-A70 family protein [Oxytricha trifallax]
MDPPWNDTACKLGYQILKDIEIFKNIPIHKLQKNGYLFIWITNSKLESCLEYLKSIGYKRAEILTWVKLNDDKTLHSGIGFDLRHVTEFCVVARPENKFSELKKISFTHNVPNIILSPVRLVSQKPDQLYDYIEQLLPNRKYAEIFGRPHNHRPYWTTIGNEAIYFLNGQPSKVQKQ